MLSIDPTVLTQTSRTFQNQWFTRVAWRNLMHRGQAPPEYDDWQGWVLRAGRGFGKTLVGSMDSIEHSLDHDRYRYGVIAPTLGDVRGTCFEGETGIITLITVGNAQLPGMGMVEGVDYHYNRTLLELTFAHNGSLIKGYGTERPDRLRGPQHHRLWFEELASIKDAHKGDALGTTFNNAMLGLRLKGSGPTQWLATTTPRFLQLMIDVEAKPRVFVTRGTTYDNLANLSPEFAEAILQYEGTHLGRQELSGEIITEDPDALWRWLWIEENRLDEVPDMITVAVGVDPSGGGDEIGIVTGGVIASPCPCGLEDQKGPHYAVLDDRSLRTSPEGWALVTAQSYHDWEADVIVAERNYGGDMVESTIRNHDPALPVRLVSASRGKQVRAQPISLLYERGQVHHIGAHAKLESEQTSWNPVESKWSPNRLDALVWALTSVSTGISGERRAHAPRRRDTPMGRVGR